MTAIPGWRTDAADRRAKNCGRRSNGTLYTSLGKINIKRREFAEDDGPLDPNCRCY
ncbi:hypothetical protein, partial [Desulfovibrio desulfuricans]|uniref:hypothetical protein n=1 Tax=Desulfovibrio desulfuricans TaxID=876 RepID=UPI0038B3ED4A